MDAAKRDELWNDHEKILACFRMAQRDAAIKHRALGVPMVIWRDGAVVEVPPDEIVIAPEEDIGALREGPPSTPRS